MIELCKNCFFPRNLLTVAVFFVIACLCMSVSSFIIHYVVLGIYRFAEGHNIEGLRDISLTYIHDNFFLVSQVPDILLEILDDVSSCFPCYHKFIRKRSGAR